MQIVLFEDQLWSRFLPLVYTRPVGELRMGMMTQAQRYARVMNTEVVHDTRPYLRALFAEGKAQIQLHVNARLFPNETVLHELKSLTPGDVLKSGETIIARCTDNLHEQPERICRSQAELIWIERITDLFALNAMAMKFDFELMPKTNRLQSLHSSNCVIGDASQLFVHEKAKVYASTLNTLDGPIYIDADAEIMEGTHIRGGFYLGEHATLKLGSKIYGATTIGPQCKVGGEVSNSIFYGHSNKAHDGFVGNSLIGEWCNLGADTNTSNLKNNYSHVKIWSYETADFADTGLTFCGLIMGDHSKCGINTMFNTGTVTGVNANIYGGGFPDKHIPSFSWGGPEGWEVYDSQKAFDTISKVMQRRGQTLTDAMRNLLLYIFEETAHHRNSAS
jgi:UDP-N-acetylglucosamine diphosphorylase/glucosamine-1-phosphate N-acetyltransferase